MTLLATANGGKREIDTAATATEKRNRNGRCSMEAEEKWTAPVSVDTS